MADTTISYDEMIKGMDTADFDQADTWFSEAEYQGFQPGVIASVLKTKWEAFSKNVQEWQNLGSLTFGKMTSKLASYFAMRGTAWSEKAKNKSKTSASAFINKLVTLYDIKGKQASAASLKKDTMTFGRIAAVIAPMILKARVIAAKKTGVNMQVVGETGGAPKVICFPHFPACLQEKDFKPNMYKKVMDAWLTWAINFDKVVNKTTADESKVKAQAEILKKSNWVSATTMASCTQILGSDQEWQIFMT